MSLPNKDELTKSIDSILEVAIPIFNEYVWAAFDNTYAEDSSIAVKSNTIIGVVADRNRECDDAVEMPIEYIYDREVFEKELLRLEELKAQRKLKKVEAIQSPKKSFWNSLFGAK